MGDLALNGKVVSFGIRGLHVLVDRALADRWKGLRDSRTRQWTGIVGVHRHRCNVLPRYQTHHGVGGGVLDRVKGYVAEVTLVADAVAATQAGPAIAKHVPCETDTWPEVLVIRFPEHASVLGKLDRTIANLIEGVTSRTHHKIGVESGIRIVLDAIVLPAQSRVKGEAGRNLPRILAIECEIVVAIVTLKARWPDRQRQRAGWRHDISTGIRIPFARELALRRDRALELVNVTRDQVGDSGSHRVRPQIFNRSLVGAKYAVVTNVNVLAPELELVLTFGKRDVIVKLVEILRSTERDGFTGCVREVSGKHQGEAAHRRDTAGRVQRWAYWSAAQRVDRAKKPVVNHLGRVHQIRAKDVVEAKGVVLIELVRSGVIAGVGTGANRACEIQLVVPGITRHDRRFVRQVVVNLTNFVPDIGRRSAACVGRYGEGDYVASQRRAGCGVDRMDSRSRSSVLRKKSLARGCQRRVGGGIDNRKLLGSSTAYADPLKIVEEEQFVFLDGAAHRKAKIVARENTLRCAGGTVFVSVRREGRDAVEFVRASVQLIGAGLGNQVDHAAAGPTKLSRKVAGHDAEFLHRVERNGLPNAGRK